MNGLHNDWSFYYIIKLKIRDKLKQNGGEIGKMSVDRRFGVWYNANKTAVNGRKTIFTAGLRGKIYDWTHTRNKRIE